MSEALQLLTAFLGAAAFAGIYRIPPKKLAYAGLGGLIGWGVYLLLGHLLPEEMQPAENIRYFMAAFAATVYSDHMAHVQKQPVTVMLLPSIIPLVPGASLYNTMQLALDRQYELSADKAVYTALLACAIAVGIIVAMTLLELYHKTVLLLKKTK